MENKDPQKADPFEVILLAIIFDPEKRKILIGRQEGDDMLGPKFTWGFPGAYLHHKENMSDILKKRIKDKTGYDIKNLGAVFAKVYPENEKFMAIYFLCEAVSGELKAGEPFREFEWVDPEEIEKRFTTSFHKRLKEYILNLK